MGKASVIKTAARSALRGKYGYAALVMLLYWAITFIVFLPGVLSLFLLPLPYGLVAYFLGIARGETASVETLFEGYSDFIHVFWTELLKGIYQLLWLLLLFVPGLVKSYSYAMTEYIMRDNPDLSANATIERSMEMMKGHKAELFWLDLTFIGWGLLCVITLGLAAFYVAPYYYAARAEFYERLLAAEADELTTE